MILSEWNPGQYCVSLSIANAQVYVYISLGTTCTTILSPDVCNLLGREQICGTWNEGNDSQAWNQYGC